MKILLIILFLSSCSSLKSTLVYSSLSGAMAGGATGYMLSPDKESNVLNVGIGALIGAGLSAFVGYLLFEDDPRNKKLKPMMLDEKNLNPNMLGLDFGGIKIEANLIKKGKFTGPVTKLPKELEGKIKKQFVIKYQSTERYINKGNKTYYIPSFQIFEHAYESLGLGGQNE